MTWAYTDIRGLPNEKAAPEDAGRGRPVVVGAGTGSVDPAKAPADGSLLIVARGTRKTGVKERASPRLLRLPKHLTGATFGAVTERKPRLPSRRPLPDEERATETSGVLDAAEAFGKAWLILQGLEVAFGERVVVGRVRTVMRTGHTQIGEQKSRGFRFHWTTAIGMEHELAGRHIVFRDRIVEQRPEQRGAFSIRHEPADHAAAEDVEDHVEIEVRSLRRSYQLGDVPGPDLIGFLRQKFRLLINRMAHLPAAFADFAVLTEQATHGADRAVIVTLIEQGGIDLGRRLVSETGRMRQIEHRALLRDAQGPGWPRTRTDDRRRRAQAGPPALHIGAGNPERGAGSGGQSAGRHECHDRFGQGTPSLDASGMPSSAATFFGCR